MLVSEAHGLPVAFLVIAANTHESQLIGDVLTKVRVPRIGGRTKTRILEMAMDRAIDAGSLGEMISTAVKRRPVLVQIAPYEKALPTATGELSVRHS